MRSIQTKGKQMPHSRFSVVPLDNGSWSILRDNLYEHSIYLTESEARSACYVLNTN
jgi:hypothetical protein